MKRSRRLRTSAVLGLIFLGITSVAWADDHDRNLKTTLLVQAAMQQARECLKLGEHGTAIRLLEGQLADANGSNEYLGLLEEAYRHHIAKLKRDGREDLAQKYHERWLILKPQVKESSSLTPVEATPRPPLEMSKPAPVVVRGQQPRETPTADANAELAQAHQDFEARRYPIAAQHFQKAATANVEMPITSKERWAYCKLFVVTQQLNQLSVQGLPLDDLENEVRQAMTLAPRLEYGQKLLQTINERKGKAGGGTVPPQGGLKSSPPSGGEATTSIRHLSQTEGSWQVAESPNFRLFHKDKQQAEEMLAIAERARAAVQRKWLGQSDLPNWSKPCDIYLHPTAQDYTQATHMPADSPGHSDIQSEAGDATKVLGRRIDLHADLPYMLHSVLPHEVTHVSLAGAFGTRPLPRWADEGLAMLSETYERLGLQLQLLPAAYEGGSAFNTQQLLQSADYPDASRLPIFYAQSVCLVQYLTELRGPVAFTTFLKDGCQRGMEVALRIHYGLELSDLDQRLRHYVVVQGMPSLTLAARR